MLHTACYPQQPEGFCGNLSGHVVPPLQSRLPIMPSSVQALPASGPLHVSSLTSFQVFCALLLISLCVCSCDMLAHVCVSMNMHVPQYVCDQRTAPGVYPHLLPDLRQGLALFSAVFSRIAGLRGSRGSPDCLSSCCRSNGVTGAHTLCLAL